MLSQYILLISQILVTVFCVNSTQQNETDITNLNFCGGIFEGDEIFIRSPNYPEKYPSNIICDYHIKGSGCSKYRIHFLNFTLGSSENCVKERLEIENQETFCGKRNGSRGYHEENGSLKLRFVSNDSNSGNGFSLFITKISCESKYVQRDPKPLQTEPRYNLEKVCCSNPYNTKKFLLTSPTFPQNLSQQIECLYKIRKANSNICRLKLNFLYFWIEPDHSGKCSKGFLSISGKRFCGCHSGLKITTTFNRSDIITFFLNKTHSETNGNGFAIEVVQEECENSVGTNIYHKRQERIIWPEQTEEEPIQKLKLFKEYRDVLNSATSPNLTIRNFYFYGEPTDNGISFASKHEEKNSYKDIDNLMRVTIANNDIANCAMTLISNTLHQYRSPTDFCMTEQQSQNLFFFKKPVTRPTCPCIELGYLRGYFQSPWYPSLYPRYLRVCYRFRKQPDYCWVKLYFKDFNIENSFNCYKDFLAIENTTRYCGSSLHKKTVTLDLRYKQYEDIQFVTDNCYWGRGFYGTFEQIPCQDERPSTPEDEIPTKIYPTSITTSSDMPIPTTKPTCDRNIRDKYFEIVINRNFETCSIKINKSSEDICKLNLLFTKFNLSCTTEFLVVNGMRFCGFLSGRQVSINFIDNPQVELVYRGSTEIFDGNALRISGEQVNTECTGIPDVQRIRLANNPELRKYVMRGKPFSKQSDTEMTNYVVKFDENNLKGICMILHHRNTQDIKLCDILMKKYNATHCEQLKVNYNLPSNYQKQSSEMEIEVEESRVVEKIYYDEFDCENMV